MARAVDDFIRKSIEDEKDRDSIVSYENILSRLLTRIPEPLERMIARKEGAKVLDLLFATAAINERMSSQTFLQRTKDKLFNKRVESLKEQLRIELQKI